MSDKHEATLPIHDMSTHVTMSKAEKEQDVCTMMPHIVRQETVDLTTVCVQLRRNIDNTETSMRVF
jgi:hypothetical protein